MSNKSIEVRVENICLNGSSNEESGQLVLYLNIADYINLQQGKGDCARNVVFTIAKLISSKVENVVKLRAIRLLDVLVKNCGYPIHLHISRKGFLQVISSQFHQYGGDSATYSTVQLELLMEINMWYHTICQWTSYKNELVYIKHLYNLIVDRGYHFPPLDAEELAVLKPRPHTIIRSFEEFNNEQRIILNSQISELRRRGNEKDLNAVNILLKKLRHFQSRNVTMEAQREILKGITKWQEDIHQWNQKLDNNLLQDDDDIHEINLDEMKQFIESLKNVQSKVQHMLMEDLQDENFINQLFIFNDQTLHLLTKFESYQDSLIDISNDDTTSNIEDALKTDTEQEQEEDDLIHDTDKLSVTTSEEREHIIKSETEIESLAENKKEVKIENKPEPEDEIVSTPVSESEQEKNNTEGEEKGEIDEEIDNEEPGNEESVTIANTENVSNGNDERETQISIPESVKTTKSFSNPISLLNSQKKPSLATSGFMFKSKASNPAPVTTFAVSKAESSGQFKFDGKSDEITTNFKPFLDNPDN